MQQERRRLLEESQIHLVTDLDETQALLYLQSVGILPENVVDQISSHQMAQKRRLEIIKAVKVRGDAAYDAFYKALLFSNQEHLAGLLRPLVSLSVLNSCENNRMVEPAVLRGVANCDSEENKNPTSWVDETPMVLSGILDLSIDGVDNDSTKHQLNRFHSNKNGIYSNFSSPKGMCLIINNRYFANMAERKGTEVDCRNLDNLFKHLGYVVEILQNLSAQEMLKGASDFAKNPLHSRCDSLFVIVLTHGENQVLIGSDGEHVEVEQLLSQFNSVNARHLAGKPKLFIFQACRGEKYDHGVTTHEVEQTDSRGTVHPDAFAFNPFACLRPKTLAPEGVRLPVESDFLVAYATASSYVSWRNSIQGSWFVQAICEVFSRHAKDLDMTEMLTIVNRRVAHGKATTDMKKQIPDFSSRLRKKFYFFPGVTLNKNPSA